MKSTKKSCAIIKKRAQIARERREMRILSVALALILISLITINAVPGLIGCGIITTLLIADANLRRRF